MCAGVSYPPKTWPISVYQDSNHCDAQGNNFAKDDVLVSLEAENDSSQPGQFRAVVMHQSCDNGEIIIEFRDGVFDQSLCLQRGVIFSYTFGHVPLATASQTALNRSVSFVIDGKVRLTEEPW